MPRDDHGYGWFCTECRGEFWTEDFERTDRGPVCGDCAECYGLREPAIELVPPTVRDRYRTLREAA